MRFSRMLCLLVGSSVAMILTVLSGVSADNDLKPVSVAAFKNGLAFVVRQGDVPLENGAGKIAPIPAATLGSLWITPNDAKVTLDEVVAYRYHVAGHQNLTALADLLLANAGKMVTVRYGDQKEYTGEIVGFREPEPSAELSGSIISNESVSPRPPHIVPEVLLLKMEGKLIALRIGNLIEVTLPPDPVLQIPKDEERKALRFRVKGAGNHANLTMGYLENGVGWTPSYMILLQDDKTALVTMQAVVIDDAEDLKDADMFFVVGVPNFAYAHIPSPMALQQTLLDFEQAAIRKEGGVIGGVASNALMNQRVAMVADERLAGSASLEAAVEELQGAPEEDLFLYTRSGVTLAKGERASYNVFSGSVSYEHIYQWEVQDAPRVDAYGNISNYQTAQGSDQAARNNIWHALRVKNTTKFPWTSAPALVISGTKPVSQDTLPYTPKGAVSNLKLTIATDIRSSHDEREVGRQQSVLRRRGMSYDEVTVEGTLIVKNYKSKEVRLNIEKTLRGSVESQTDGGKAEKLGEAISVDNPMSRLTWEITLKPGEERSITYRYKLLVRV